MSCRTALHDTATWKLPVTAAVAWLLPAVQALCCNASNSRVELSRLLPSMTGDSPALRPLGGTWLALHAPHISEVIYLTQLALSVALHLFGSACTWDTPRTNNWTATHLEHFCACIFYF